MRGRQGLGDRRYCGRNVVVRRARCFHAVVERGEEWMGGWGARDSMPIARAKSRA